MYGKLDVYLGKLWDCGRDLGGTGSAEACEALFLEACDMVRVCEVMFWYSWRGVCFCDVVVDDLVKGSEDVEGSFETVATAVMSLYQCRHPSA